MACGPSGSASELNKLIVAPNATHTVVVEFGNYMNSGSWKYNTGRIDILLQGLQASGISVQLKFLEGDASRDLVRVLLDGKEIAFHPDMQHNKNYASISSNTEAILSSVKKALGKA